MIIVARVARTGLQSYGDHEERRDVAEVFAADSLATWVGAPLIVGHRPIDVSNVNDFAVGYVESVERDRGDGDGTEYVRARVVLTDASVVAKVRAGELAEFSAGYSVALTDDEPPRQTQIRIEHLAIGPRDWARCGPACSIAA